LGTSNTLDSSDSGWFYHYDEAGNVILITDKNGGLIKHFEQDAWGNDLNGTFSTTQNIRQHQTGKYLDEATGHYFFGARWYDPAIGRFISVSPLSPLGEEEYVYCSENPVNSADVNGLWNLWNPATWLEPNALEWTLLNSINPFHPSSGYHLDTMGESTSKGLRAFVDGFIPGMDPFKDYYTDNCGNNDNVYQWSYWLGGVTRDIEMQLALPASMLKLAGIRLQTGLHPSHHNKGIHFFITVWTDSVKGSNTKADFFQIPFTYGWKIKGGKRWWYLDL